MIKKHLILGLLFLFVFVSALLAETITINELVENLPALEMKKELIDISSLSVSVVENEVVTPYFIGVFDNKIYIYEIENDSIYSLEDKKLTKEYSDVSLGLARPSFITYCLDELGTIYAIDFGNCSETYGKCYKMAGGKRELVELNVESFKTYLKSNRYIVSGGSVRCISNIGFIDERGKEIVRFNNAAKELGDYNSNILYLNYFENLNTESYLMSKYMLQKDLFLILKTKIFYNLHSIFKCKNLGFAIQMSVSRPDNYVFLYVFKENKYFFEPDSMMGLLLAPERCWVDADGCIYQMAYLENKLFIKTYTPVLK